MMKVKITMEITNCSENCPYFSLIFKDNSAKGFCTHGATFREIKNPKDISLWCDLRKYRVD